MKRYWVSFTSNAEDFRPLRIGEIKHWWCSGYDCSDNAILCAVVDANSKKKAWAKVKSLWPEATHRFLEEKPLDWMPEPTRFPAKQ